MKRHVISVAAALALVGGASPIIVQDATLARARALLEKVPLIDGHNDLPWTLREHFASDLSRVDLRQRVGARPAGIDDASARHVPGTYVMVRSVSNTHDR
jgi:membrane dipeptidase